MRAPGRHARGLPERKLGRDAEPCIIHFSLNKDVIMHIKYKRVALAALVAASCLAANASAEPTTAETVTESKRATAHEVSRLLNDQGFTGALSKAFRQAPHKPGNDSVATSLRSLLATFNASGSAATSKTALASTELLALRAKGTATHSRGLFELRLHVPAGASRPARLDKLWVAFAPAGNESTWTSIQAYDSMGQLHRLDPRVSDQPLLIVDVDGREDMRAGIQVMNDVLRDNGMQEGNDAAMRTAGGNELTVLQKIKVRDVEEPWISGDADMYAIESGITTGGDKPRVVIHDMPWLDDSDTTYYPGQHVVFWANHALGVANLQLMEQDDNTDWNAKAKAILTAVTTIVGPIQPEVAVVGAIGQAILAAFPDDVLTNEDDYVDSYYLLERGKSYYERAGARNNATATFEPLSLPGGTE